MRYRLKIGKRNQFSQFWTGPHMVILANPTAVKVTGSIPWIHHIRAKKAVTSCDEDTWKAVQDPQNLHKVQFQRQQPSPMKNTEPRFSHSGSLTSQCKAEAEDSSAFLQPHSST